MTVSHQDIFQKKCFKAVSYPFKLCLQTYRLGKIGLHATKSTPCHLRKCNLEIGNQNVILIFFSPSEDDAGEVDDEDAVEYDEEDAQAKAGARPRRMSEIKSSVKVKPLPKASSFFIFSHTNR